MVLDKILEFLRHQYEGHKAMTATLQTILDKLNSQGQQIASQGAQIDKLIADRSAQEQADLQKISDLIDTNAAAAQSNADKMTGALASDASGVQQPAPQTDLGGGLPATG